MKYLLLGVIKFYQFFISPWFGRNCKYDPTCSVYAKEAIERHGAIKGGYFSLKRILKCHPFSSSSGYDPVPK